MRAQASLLILLSFVALPPFGCKDDPITGPGIVNPGDPCDREEDCDDSNDCTFDFCVGGRCEPTLVNNNDPQPNATQTDGDCQLNACVDGVPAVIEDVNDPGEDPNQGDCMVSTCVMGAPTSVPAPVGDGCDYMGNFGMCDAMGACSCAPAVGAQNPQAWVDPVDGTDMPGQGARPGGCAFQTLTYALTQYQGTIRLAGGLTLDAASGETLPFVLSGAQRVACSDFNNGRSTLSGNGTHSSGTATVVFSGTQNEIDECNVVGQGAANCVAVVAAGVNGGHDVRDSDLSGCTNGITVTATGDDITVAGCQIHNNSGVGLSLLGGDKQGNLDSNVFMANGTDLSCASASPMLGGQNNTLTSCIGCMECMNL